MGVLNVSGMHRYLDSGGTKIVVVWVENRDNCLIERRRYFVGEFIGERCEGVEWWWEGE
jgi:hypothetical protein